MTATPYPYPRETRESTLLVGNGTPGPYGPSDFKIFDVADVVVLARAVGEDRFSDVTLDATVTKSTGAAFDTFSVTFDATIPATTNFVLQSKRVHERQTAVTKGGALSSNELEKELSKQGTVIEELRRDADRSLAFQPDFDGDVRLPTPEAEKLLGWDLAAKKLVNRSAAQLGLVVVLDEDDMASDSPTSVPSQQSVKAYVDSSVVNEVIATGSVTPRSLSNRFADHLNVKDFGAVGDGVADDTASFNAAFAAGKTIYVPETAAFYSLTALSATNREKLYGPGRVKVSGVFRFIQSVASPVQPNTDQPLPYLGAILRTHQPAGQSGITGSVGRGPIYTDVKRTGGKGQYGNWLSQYTISAPTVATEFDTGITSWATHQNLAGGSVFGMWSGANSPSSALGQTFSSGAVIGQEINAGNRWGDFGLQSDVGGTRYSVGLQVVPDVLPAEDGATASIYPGTFGVVLSASIHGHKWWTGNFVRTDAIVPGGYINRENGGSVVGNAVLAHTKLGGYLTDVFDFESATIATDILRTANLRLGASGLAVFGSKTQYQVNSEAGSAFTPAVQIHGAGAAATAGITRWSADANQGRFVIAKSRGAAIGTRGAVVNGDVLGSIIFNGDDGTNFIPGAFITAAISLTPGANDMPTDLLFGTTADGTATPATWMALRSYGLLDLVGSARVHGQTAIPAGGAAGKGLVLSSTANFGVFFGSGVPTLAAAKGSLYLRSDGTSTSTRMYVNTDGNTAWTAVTTAA
ncbi:hypothetical protein GGQ99_000958 [Aminobacter niigataensis]|uniref:Pectate lyase superfamily protein n=1 Tax=Aminobacter niigataensis TaxID=83265 RepID=A0ABR6KXU4_9HYPH|nr:glycosyl hydrolase family 28-related protein [Aminobacter niigataensis]MBB4649236.1 hypothetical protein [Aminobacter niigataensis]